MHVNIHNGHKEFILRSQEPLALTAGIALYQELALTKHERRMESYLKRRSDKNGKEWIQI